MDQTHEEPRLSVAMGTYNGATYVRQQLESIAAQTHKPDEVVICDDCSADGTQDIVQTFAQTSPFPLRLHVNETNVGVRRNFERAISLCTGNLIALCDQDDVWHPQKLQRSITALAAAPEAGFVFMDADVVDEYSRPLGYSLWESVDFSHSDRQMFREGRALDVLLAHNVVTGTTMVFRSTFRDLVLPIPVDYPYWIHDGWIAAVAEASFIEEAPVLYRQHSAHQIGAGPRSGSFLFSTSFARMEHLRRLHARLSLHGTMYQDAAARLLASM
jgi:glycosyltransferase involved in cell wall biosynthesis